MTEVTGSIPVEDTSPEGRRFISLAEILKVIVPVMVGPTAHKRLAGVWSPVRGVLYQH